MPSLVAAGGSHSLVAVCELPTVVASVAAAHSLSSCAARGMWNLPRPGIEPMFPVLEGRLFTTGPTREIRLFS